MQAHWCRRLKGGIGREIETKACNIENLERKKSELLKQLDSVNRDLQIQEHELLESIKEEWTAQEINTARNI
ncbi:hypothetical protein [uncultured Flavobacterium sp.]|uniref:hypothetical protein n=1 Tax=uncultured Flavobacterium sp. TaxID=165435 RepID=UPI002592B0A0|nr:hypothetical protein [uncultured Flavobacterium sp.]